MQEQKVVAALQRLAVEAAYAAKVLGTGEDCAVLIHLVHEGVAADVAQAKRHVMAQTKIEIKEALNVLNEA